MSKAARVLQQLEELNPSVPDGTASIVEMAWFLENGPVINEEKFDLSAMFGKIGLKITKGQGLIQILAKAGTHVAKLLWLAVKAYRSQTPEDKEELKTFLKNTKVTKEQVVDVLLKLDMLTNKMFTGPVAMLNVLTGWQISVNIKQDIERMAKSALQGLLQIKDKLADKTKKVLDKHVTGIKNLLGVQA